MRTLTFHRIVGSGAMGTVYAAELRVPRGFSRSCAVKVMKTHGPEHDHFRGRMRDEARLLGMLQDESVLGVSELVEVEGRDAVIMEFVDGVDLSEIIRHGPVPPRALAELGAEVAGTLHRAHVATHPQTDRPLSVIHRDIKPANLMITTRGGLRVLDFGVARAAFGSRESQTQGLVLGTLNYFPPEVLAGSEPTPAVDIYGLGLTLWECASGRDWGAPRVQRAQFERRVDRRIDELDAAYDPLVPVLRQVLQWDPELRPDGGAVERMLLSAADECSGTGLRRWGREVIPGLLSARKVEVQEDPLVGRTVSIGSEDITVTELHRSEATRRELETAYRSYDDVGPPAASRREQRPRRRRGRERAPREREAGGRARSSGGVPMWAIVGLGILLGGAVGVLLLAVLFLLLAIFWMG